MAKVNTPSTIELLDNPCLHAFYLQKSRHALRMLMATINNQPLMDVDEFAVLYHRFAEFLMIGNVAPLVNKLHNVHIPNSPAHTWLQAITFNYLFRENPGQYVVTRAHLTYFLTGTIDYYSSLGFERTLHNIDKRPCKFVTIKREAEKTVDAIMDYESSNTGQTTDDYI